MRLYSSKDRSHTASFEEACMRGLAPNRGLYMPIQIPQLPGSFINHLDNYTLDEIAFEVGHRFLGDEIPSVAYRSICKAAFDFPAPVVPLTDRLSILELFHGPSLAFKDFGARFMAQTMGYFNRNADNHLIILVATSGDTGGAVAAGFYETEGIEVVILYPKGRVSRLQELQLTTLGKNIHSLQVDGSFDDCQDLVKTAFNDATLNQKLRLSSANSINIARLIPQSFYYFESYKQLSSKNTDISYCVPSGNFGNLTAGLIAKKMGLPIKRFIAATNINDVVPQYLKSGLFEGRKSRATLSNAMDVGNPSNFTRMQLLYPSLEHMRLDIEGFSLEDNGTIAAILKGFNQFGYIFDPHTAIAYEAANQLTDTDEHCAILATAHPSKFLNTVEQTIGISVDIPANLASLQAKKPSYVEIAADFNALSEYLMHSF